ncbi:alpha/beta hydrolase fold domain-containing protein [Jannaschia sp. R86511]|uniref:alpha/beta hydrolase fold domain-containing protein n=1 Tax=Jannaschia sp. R86511 TaxID=3093853 RepID=UPI0036D25F73
MSAPAGPTSRPQPRPSPRPPFDPDVARALHDNAADLVTSMTPEQVLEVRQRPPRDPDPTEATLSRDGRFTVRTVHAPGPVGAPDVPLVVCTPVWGVSGRAVRHPVLYYVHGGGLVAGNAWRDLPPLLDLAHDLGLAVVSVEHRLAPETPYPGPVEDCYAGLVWLASAAPRLGLDPDAVVVGGTSAGGGLAAAVALLARDRSGPALRGQLLLCPMLDDRNDRPSTWQMAGAGVWDRTANATGWAAMLGEAAGGPDVPAYAAPSRAEDLAGLPATYVDVGSADTFRDEDVAYAAAIWAAGGDAELHVWPGGCHGFEHLAPTARLSRDAVDARRRWLRRVLTR